MAVLSGISPSLLLPGEGCEPGPNGLRLLACNYCREPIPLANFSPWSSAGRLMSASCGGCARVTTVPSPAWRRHHQHELRTRRDARMAAAPAARVSLLPGRVRP
jgi:hypothetical protein